ncbi:MAG: hypothetical protein JWM44_486 [Bacilli bacterium]|nr:hypothetical protein [Bacilli bacterium]
MDAAGNLNAEMILHVTPPVIQDAQISSDNHNVTITFQESVVDNTYSEGTSYLKNYICLMKSGNYEDKTSLTADDTASDVSGKLIIHFAAALSGGANKIIIDDRGALKDSYGNVRNDETLTPLIQVNGIVDTTAPKLLNSYLSNTYQDFTLVFDEYVQNAQSDEASFRAGIQYWGGITTGGNWVSIPSTATLTFSGKTVIIHFAAQLTNNYYYFQINSNSFKDTSGNIFKDEIRTGQLYTTPTLILQNGSISHDGRWMSLNSNLNNTANLADHTVVDGVSDLKEKITISTDHGSTFSALDAQDVVSFQGTRIVVLFHNAKNASSFFRSNGGSG